MHEAGHAIVAEVLNPGSVKVVSICRHYDRVKQILIQNKELFESLVELLLEKKTLTYKDIGELFTGKNLAS